MGCVGVLVFKTKTANKPTHNRSYPCAGKLSTGRCVSLLAKEHTYKLLLPAGRNCPGKRKDPPGEIPPAKSEPGAKSKAEGQSADWQEA